MKRGESSMIRKALLVLSVIALISLYAFSVFSLPAGPVLQNINNSTSSSSGVGSIRTGDDGGTITTLALNVSQQNLKWKAYVGNVSGRYVLEDADGFSIYEWDMSLNSQGKVFISRNQTVDWSTVACSARATIYSEESDLNILTADSDSINGTFSATVHQSFNVAGTPISNSTCPAIATYINGSSQASSESADFQEILLADNNGNGNLIYTTILEQDETGYRNDSTYDFQVIVGDDETAATVTDYYFYVELGI